MKTIAILQPSFLPWLGYYEQMVLADVFVHFDDVQFTRQDWRSRNRLKSPAGIKVVAVPVQKHEFSKTLINEIRVVNGQPWNRKLLKQIRAWYAKAEYFDDYFSAFQEILEIRFERLVDLNYALNDLLRNILCIDTPQYLSSEIPNKSEDRNMKIIDICRHHGADLLYEGQSGQNFMDLDMFRRNGDRVVFQEYRHKPYPQLWGSFESHLSVLDLLLNCGLRSRDIILSSPSPVFLTESKGLRTDSKVMRF
ncbi:MAG: WbqC family protein [Desulforhabdus sp.]|jgi:hypothetical protein|nr:WbqC family protein [Desulforhabdus sp.]